MLLVNVYTKTLRDHWLGVAIGSTSIGLMVAMGVAAGGVGEFWRHREF